MDEAPSTTAEAPSTTAEAPSTTAEATTGAVLCAVAGATASACPTATLIKRKGPRAADWYEVMRGWQMPLRSPERYCANIPGYGEAHYYELDVGALTYWQFERLVVFLAVRYGYDEDFVRRTVAARGCPVLAEDVIVMGNGGGNGEQRS